MQKIYSLIILITIPFTLLALKNDRNQPLHIQADNAIIDRQKDISTYTGNVKFTQGTTQLLAHKVTINLKNNKIFTITAVSLPKNQVKYEEQDDKNAIVNIQADSVNIDVENNIVHLNDNAQITRDKDIFCSQYIQYDKNNQKVIANKKNTDQQVSILIHPKKS